MDSPWIPCGFHREWVIKSGCITFVNICENSSQIPCGIHRESTGNPRGIHREWVTKNVVDHILLSFVRIPCGIHGESTGNPQGICGIHEEWGGECKVLHPVSMRAITSKFSSVSSVVRITLTSISLFPVASIHRGVFTFWRYHNASFSGRLLISFINCSLISSLNVG